MTQQTPVFSPQDLPQALSRMRKGVFWAGMIMILLGMAALVLPRLGSLVVEIFVGWLLTISGGVTVIGAFALRGLGVFIWELLAGALVLAAGLVLLVFPAQGLVALTLLLAFVFVMTGLAQGAFALWMRPLPGWLWSAVSGAVSLALGAFILATLPEASPLLLGVLVGVDFLSTGVALVLIARAAQTGF